jgi:hypothetical protein
MIIRKYDDEITYLRCCSSKYKIYDFKILSRVKHVTVLFDNKNVFENNLSIDMIHILVIFCYFSVISCLDVSPKRKMSWPLQMFDAAPMLDGSLAGDAGFDPLNISRDKETLFLLREGEIKHARIAMLAAVGWPVSELYHYALAGYFNSEIVPLGSQDRAPSVLNGGLDNEYVLLSLGTFFAVGAVLELELMRRRRQVPPALRNFFEMWREDGWDTPGNYGFG